MQPNIVEDIRKQAALTQKKVAELSDLSTLYIIRAEQGMSATLPLSLLTTLSNIDSEARTVNVIESTYTQQRDQMIAFWVDQVRCHPANDMFVETALGYSLDNFVAPVGKKEQHPFYLFRTKFMALHSLPTSAIKFAAMFGIHPATISNIEKRAETLEGVTADRMRALGLSEVQLEMLMKACDVCL